MPGQATKTNKLGRAVVVVIFHHHHLRYHGAPLASPCPAPSSLYCVSSLSLCFGRPLIVVPIAPSTYMPRDFIDATVHPSYYRLRGVLSVPRRHDTTGLGCCRFTY